MKICLVFFCACVLLAAVSAANYCELDCYNQGIIYKNIACGHTGQFDPYNCPGNAEMVEMTENLKEILVTTHNEKRNIVAGGGAFRHAAACNMATMKWNDELAYLASLNVRQCQIKHDKCRATETFRHSGQNLFASYTYVQAPLDYAELVKGAVDSWYSEVDYSYQGYINAYPRNYNGPKIGHFTVMVHENNTDVGCSASTYGFNGEKHFLLACNYAANNFINNPIYTPCNVPAQSCNSTNSDYPNLCAL